MADQDGAGGAKIIPIDIGPGVNLTVKTFGSFGPGGTPADPAEVDTLAFTGSSAIAANMTLAQSGADVIIIFDGDPNATTITLENTAIEQLGNIAGLGNFQFSGESAVTDSLDIWSAAENGPAVHHPNAVTFLNALANNVKGFDDGSDVINGLAGDDTLNGLARNDILRGGEGNDLLIGGLGNDRLVGGEGNDSLLGGRGDDVLDGGNGSDLLTGGKGNDIYVVDSLGDTIVEDIANSRGGGWADEVRSSVTFSLASLAQIENLTLTGADNIDGTGNSGANIITGNFRDNILKGGGGSDVLRGGGGDGADSFHGNTGDDVIVLDSDTFLQADGGSGIDAVRLDEFGPQAKVTGELGARFQNIEVLDLGGSNANTITLDGASVAQIAGSSGAFGPDTLLIKGDAGDAVHLFDPGWVKGGEITDPFGQSGSYASWTKGTATALIETELLVTQVSEPPDDGFTIIGAALGDRAGSAVSSAGDVNGDGIDDVIVGAYRADPASGIDAGASYVIYGKAGGLGDVDLATLTASEGFRINGAAAGDQSGFEVSNAGDLNGDGIGDLVIGALTADPSGRNGAGNSYVVYGKTGGLADIDLAALTAGQGAVISGATADDQSGQSVKSAGDVNGDGIDDIIIGAPEVDGAADYGVGESYVIYGKLGGIGDVDLAALTAAQGFKILGAQGGDYSGQSVSGAGDINGDGFDDVIVGANAGVPGESWIVFGKSGGPGDIDLAALTPAQGFKISGFGDYESSGHTVGAAGDINGDGFEDLVIGVGEAPALGRRYAGHTIVIYGKAGGPGDIDLETLTPDQGFKVLGAAEYDFSGRAISSAGDVNGDGIDDLLIGAASADPDGLGEAGEAYLIFGQAGGLSDIDLASLSPGQGLKIPGVAEHDATGAAVSAAGDVNGDGFADIIVGASQWNPIALGNGKAYVIYGGDFTASVTHGGTAGDDTLTGTGADETFVGGLGNDMLIGGGGADSFHGGAGDDVIVLSPGDVVRVDGGNGIDTVTVSDFGPALDFTGDLRTRFQSIEILDIDQFQVNQITLDVASIAHMTGSNGGAFGPNTLLVKGDEGDIVTFADQGWIRGGEITDPFGQDGTYISWTNGAVTALVAIKTDAFPMGRVDLADLTPDEGFKIVGASGIGAAGDVNADGYDDFVVNADQSYVIFGKADGLKDIDLATLTPDQGFVVARTALPGDEGGPGGGSTGDFNGDGIDDVVFGAASADTAGGTDAGEAYVVFGAVGGPGNVDVTTMSPAQGFRISGAAPYDNAGFATAPAGDFNGDGIDDVLVDARRADPNGLDRAGEVYLIYGKVGGPGDIDLAALTLAQGFKIAGEHSSQHVGEALNAAGDINGDGLDDLFIGAPYTGDGIGRAYVLYGKLGGSGDIDLAALTPDQGFTINGFSNDDFLGRSVSSAGDINGDGINDLVLSAYRGGFDSSGVVYVVYGKEGGLGDVDLTTQTSDDGFRLFGFQGSGQIGRWVSSAGDVNGDGIDDILVGAPNLDVADREQAGQAYVIYGKEGGPGDIDLTNLGEDQGFAIAGAAADDRTGRIVSALGDVNGDGFADVGVNAPYADPAGNSYVIYGGDITGSVTHLGTSGDDVLTGAAAAESFVGGLGNDLLNGGGGADAFHGGAGDDAIHVADGGFKKVDGGNGADTLHLDFGGLIDLGNIDGDAATSDHTKIQNVETIDTDNGSSNQIALSLSDVLQVDADDRDVGGVASLDNVLKIDGDAGDSLSLDPADGWSAADTTTLAGYAVYTAGSAKIAIDQDIVVAVA